MFAFFTWYLFISLLGLLTFPLAWRLFPALADRAYGVSRVLGLLLWGFLFWWLVSLGIIQNDGGGLALSLAVVAGLSAWALWKTAAGGRGQVRAWLHANRRVVIVTEVLFFLAFAAWAFVRASNPELTSSGGEKTMEVAFINAIMRSESFPPHDPWLSGYAISYYYFGYVLTAMLAEVSGVAGSVAHNLMLALVFALSAVSAYSLLYNLLASRRRETAGMEDRKHSTGLPLLGPLFLLIVSNLEGFLEVLHANGIFWPKQEGGFNFWVWLELRELNLAPSGTGWPPRFYWWWRASRVIQDFDLAGNSQEIIDEFPFFSYLLGDLHAHVLSMPFVLLAMAVALNLFLGGWERKHSLLGFPLRIQWRGLLLAALVLGGLAFLNTWDILAFSALVLGAGLLRAAHLDGWNWRRLEEVVTLGVPLIGISLLLYLPQYLGFSSQAGGILPNLVSPTRGIHLWVMFGALFVPIFAALLHFSHGSPGKPRWLAGFGVAAGLALLLWGFSWLLAWVVSLRYPDVGNSYLVSQGVDSTAELFTQALPARLASAGGWVTLVALLGLALALIFRWKSPQAETELTDSQDAPGSAGFLLLLAALGGVLVLAPEFVYLRDNFGWRMNTVFKFYFQAWELWAVAAAFGTAVLLQELRKTRAVIFTVCLCLVVTLSLFYPLLGVWDKTAGFQVRRFKETYAALSAAGDPKPVRNAARVWTLDGAVLFERDYPADALAVTWLRQAPLGVLVEAVDGYADSYVDYAHISAYSGMPAVLGWGGHEAQWRGTYDGLAQRAADIRRVYESSSWEETEGILEQYDIRYVYIGTLERRTYRINDAKFDQHFTIVYQGDGVKIYEVSLP